MQNEINWLNAKYKVNDLIPHSLNPRKISNKQMEDLKKSLQTYNLAEIPVIDHDKTILSGHQRIKALQLLGRGEEIIDVRQASRKLTEEEAKKYLIGANALGGDWDFDLLKSFDVPMLLDLGFNEIKLSEFINQKKEILEDEINIEKEIKKITEPIVKPGDLIILGEHRVLCADSTKIENLKKLFGNKKSDMIYSDPVYNLDINYNGGIGGKSSYGGNVNDTRSFLEYQQFITDSLKSALSISNENIHVYYYCDQIYIGMIQEIYRKLGLENKRVCLWLKNSQNPVPGVAWNKAYEPCVYAILGKPYLAKDRNSNNEIFNSDLGTGNQLIEQVENLFDIWTAKRISGKEYEHATSKPISLHEKVIKRCTKPNDIILDSFLGSGSTLLCAEQLNRRVYGLELEPIFCDLIIKRWELLTGKKAVIIHQDEEAQS